jgi:hypothetical protein
MSSWLVWLVLVTASVLLGFIAYHFTVRTLRAVTAALAAAVVVLVTRYGEAHHPASGSTDLVNAFTRGFGDLSVAFFRPVMPVHLLTPGRFGWLIICGVLIFGYRELEVWAMRCQPPTVDMSALKGEQRAAEATGTPADTQTDPQRKDKFLQRKARLLQRRDELVRELRFRLPAVEVRAPAVLPGGTRASGLASIAEHSGVTAGGLAGALIEFFGMLWPNPRRYQVHVWLEPKEKTALGRKVANAYTRVTVDIEDRQTGEPVATQTLAAPDFEQAAEVVAGYVAWSIFKDDRTTPPWCYGAPDGEDIAALLLTREQRVPSCRYDDNGVRTDKIKFLEKCRLQSGVSRYELAQLHDLERHHVKALRLHAINREEYPRFFRGRYRLAMSLEMVAGLNFSTLRPEDFDDLREALRILDRCKVTLPPNANHDDSFSALRTFDNYKTLGNEDDRRNLRLSLLTTARKELQVVRKQLVLWRLLRALLWHRDERTIWIQYLGLTERQRLHDGARVAELYMTVRLCIANHERPHRSTAAGLEKGKQGRDSNRRKALRIVEAVSGESVKIGALLDNKDKWFELPSRRHWSVVHKRNVGESALRTRWLPWLRRTPSSQAAYNTACLYGAAYAHLAKVTSLKESECSRNIDRRAAISLRQAFTRQDSENQPPSGWIDVDPVFTELKKVSGEFSTLVAELREREYPSRRSARNSAPGGSRHDGERLVRLFD